MNNSLTELVNKMLPTESSRIGAYNAEHNMLLTRGYTSAAGNMYYRGINLSNRIIIVTSFGQGYLYTFINELRVYCFDGKEKKLIGSRSYYNCVYNKSFARSEATSILSEYMKTQARMMGVDINETQVKDFAQHQVLAATSQIGALSA